MYVWRHSMFMVLAALCAHGEILTYSTQRTTTPPRIDGVLDDACWDTACRIAGFSALTQSADEPTPETTAWITYDDTALFVAFHCVEPLCDRLQATATEHDGRVWADDSVEVFLSPGGDRQRYVQIAVNVTGVIMDGLKETPDAPLNLDYDSGAAAGTRVALNAYSLEVRVPFCRLPLTGPHAPWTFHLARNRRVTGQHLTSLRTRISGFHEPRAFDVLAGVALPEYPVAVLSWDLGDLYAGTNLCRLTLVNRAETPASVTLSAGLAPADTSIQLSLQPGEARDAAVPWELRPADRGREAIATVRMGDRILQQRFVRIDAIPEVIGPLRRRVHMWSQHRPLRLHIPVHLASGSRTGAVLHWQAAADDGRVVGHGQTLVRGQHALVRLYWNTWWEGHYRLHVALVTADGGNWTRDCALRLVANPWGD